MSRLGNEVSASRPTRSWKPVMLTDRKRIQRVFVAAQYYLWDGKKAKGVSQRSYLCHAMSLTHCDSQDIRRATDVVMSRLHPHVVLEAWLVWRGVPSAGINTTELVQAHRRQWLAQLIAEFST